ncbi:MAG: hypothetical protein IJX81_01355 [Clostridia bacterium]|nr:hypothetical protein [Clostridia bacterium]
MKWTCEIVQDGGVYYANLTIDGTLFRGLPEYIGYNQLKRAIRMKTGIEILNHNKLTFEKYGRKKYAFIDNTQTRDDCRVALWELLGGYYKPNWAQA